MSFYISSCALSAALLFSLVAVAQNTFSAGSITNPHPLVNLGYQRHLGNLDPTGNYYNFSNVRYAAPPTGPNRFRAPQRPVDDLGHIHNGTRGRVCAQANPGWFTIVDQWIGTYTPGSPVNITTQQVAQLAEFPSSDLPLLDSGDGRITEDCLFLDVLVPKTAMPSNHGKERTTGSTALKPLNCSKGLPVIIWLTGGGFTSGDKTDFAIGTSPAGLIEASEVDTGEGVIFVSINYRLGAFGWLAGSEVAADGNPNAGLLDQRFAFEWVQKYISLFGGDACRITVMGESAGAGSIMHHITSHGGTGKPLPFQQAILQSPAFNPASSSQKTNQAYYDLLKYAGVSDLASLRKVPFETLVQANALQVARSAYGSYTYTPVIDGLYVPGPPGALLAAGRFDKNLALVLANNADEGLLFSNPTVQTEEAFNNLVVDLAPTFSSREIRTITAQLYPPSFNGPFGYVDEITRQAAMLADLIIVCNNFYLSDAFGNRTYAYLFAVPPAFHGQDIPYTYYDGVDQVEGNIGPQTIDFSIAHAMQEILSTFAATGQPTYNGGKHLAQWGSTADMLTLNTIGFTEESHSAVYPRCRFWQSVQMQLDSS